MDEKLIKIRDFAEAHGCTPQNIYIHLKNYAEELDGHLIKGRGRQGILLDEYAQAFLRSVMYPKELGENITAQENEKLRAALAQALQENARLLSRALTAESERDQALIREGESQRLLTASQETQEAQAAELKQSRLDVSAITELFQETKREADSLHLELSQEHTARVAAESKVSEFENLPFWRKAFWKSKE